MKRLLAATALLAVLFVALISTNTFAVVQAADVCPTNPSPPDASDPSVIVDAPAAGATVKSPVSITGKARVFEANVRITIFGADGSVLADTFTTAAEAAPALSPYSASVAFTTGTQQQGCIRVFEESAQDGSPRNVVQVEVMLAPPTTPPQTGSAGLKDDKGDHDIALYGAGFLAIIGATALALHRRLWQ